jgi:hypothetical protein
LRKAFWLIPLLTFAGCNNPGDSLPSGTGGARFAKQEDLGPMDLSAKKAVLVSMGTRIPVDVQTTVNDAERTYLINLNNVDATIEFEKYTFSPSQFAIIETTDERFEPPITLAQFPMTIGDSWDWKGNIVSGTLSRAATAKVKTSSEVLAELGGRETMRVDVSLSIDSGAEKPAARDMNFWFLPKGGIVKRAFGYALTRNPAGGE